MGGGVHLRYNVPEMDDDAYLKIIRGLSAAQKLKAAEEMWEAAHQLKAAALRAQHPDWTEEEVQRAVREAFLYARG